MSFDEGLLAHWRFNGDCQDSSGNGNHGINRSADLAAVGRGGTAYGAASFDGRAAHVEVPISDSLALVGRDFTLSAWVEFPPDGANLHGDILSKYDPATRSGLNFGTLNYAGVTAAQAHHRNLHFGVDNGAQEPVWVDRGRPGNNLRVYSLCVYNGDLYTGTFEWGADEAGHMYRYAGGQTWEDCGSPDAANTVASLAVFVTAWHSDRLELAFAPVFAAMSVAGLVYMVLLGWKLASSKDTQVDGPDPETP